MNTGIVLKDAIKRYTLDQDKILPPAETVKRFKENLKNIDLDILQQTVRIDNGRLGIPVFFSICGADARTTIGTKKQMGKGATPEQAEASALMELAERFSFFHFCKNPQNFFTDTYGHVRDRAIPFEMIAQSVHDDSEDLAVTREIFESLPLKWTRAFNLTKNQETLIPFDWFYMINEFNGPSAGNCVEEALSQGICEIVERHVSALISRQKLKVAAVNPDSVSDPVVLEMLRKYRTAGIKLFLSDFTLEMGIPSIGALAYDPQHFPEKSEIVWTAGTTPDPQKALSRALTEVAQLAGDFNTHSNYVASGLPKFNTVDEADFIIHPGAGIDITALPDLSDPNIKVEVQNCIDALARNDLEVIVINTLHPRLNIPAFYTIVPGAHFRERAVGTSVGMFSAKLIAESRSPLQAIQELKKIEERLPQRYYVQFYLGTCHLKINDPETAYTYFQKSLSDHPTEEDLASIYSYMGVCLKDMEKYESALAVLEKGKAIDNQRTDIFNLMGFCHFKLKQHDQAIDCFKKLLRLNPSSAIDYANIASNYREMGQKEKAIRYYEMALVLDSSIEFARDNLARLKPAAEA